MRPTVIMIVGLPATGKSSLRAYLADALAIPAVSRDTIKELMLDQLEVSSREGSKQVGKASWHVLYYVMEQLFASGRPFIVDHYYHQQYDATPFEALCDKYQARIVEVYCWASAAVVMDRFQRRWAAGERHPGHADQGFLDTLRERLENPAHARLRVSDVTIDVDTTDLSTLDHGRIVAAIRHTLDPAAQGD